MKKLTTFAVVSVFDLLIHTNGQTTTLEVKNQLRELGYFAEQAEVHNMIEEIFEREVNQADLNVGIKYERNVISSKYNTYKFSQEYIDSFPVIAITTDDTTNTIGGSCSMTISDTVEEIKKPIVNNTKNTPLQNFHNKMKDDIGIIPVHDFNKNIPSKNDFIKAIGIKQPLASLQTTTNLREPLLIFYTENHAHKSSTDPENWVVLHKNGNNEIQIFDKSLTSDLARSRYASILGCKIQDVRCRRFKNY